MKELIQKLMEKLDLKVDEEFYLLEFDDFKKGWVKFSDCKYHFNNDLKVVNEKNQSKNSILGGLITEKFKSLKIENKPKTVWDLEKGDKFYYSVSVGGINNDTWNGDAWDLEKREVGNAFLTLEEAEFEVERRKCEAIMLKYGRRTFKYGDDNYLLKFDNTDKKVDVEVWHVYQFQGSISFDTEELAQKAIDEIGEERLKKYVFQVEE